MLDDLEVYMRDRLGELGDEHGDHECYGLVFGVIDVSDDDALRVWADHELDVEPGFYWAKWNNQGVVDVWGLEYISDYVEAKETESALKRDYADFLADSGELYD